jgi:hypothetical protein
MPKTWGKRVALPLVVARRLIAYMTVVDKTQTDFVLREEKEAV